MTRSATSQARLSLPARIRIRTNNELSVDSRLVLADRLAALPRLRAVTIVDDPLTGSPDVCLAWQPGSGPEARLLCRFTDAGIAVYGLSDRDRYQVLLSGWGRLKRDHVLLYLPRDEHETGVCRGIIEHAYFATTTNSGETTRPRAASPWDLPRFSRTSLQ